MAFVIQLYLGVDVNPDMLLEMLPVEVEVLTSGDALLNKDHWVQEHQGLSLPEHKNMETNSY